MTEYDEDVKSAVEVMRKGGIILYPTDTVWGIGCDATNEVAVKKIFEIKQRADSKSMLVLMDTPARLQGFVQTVPEMAWDLIDLSSRPLTIIYPHARNLALNLIASDGSVGIRITKEPFSKRLCEAFRGPIVSTSANISGQPTAAIFSEIDERIVSQMDYVVKYRQKDNSISKPSSIIKLDENNSVTIIRE
jgi:L-threonylcarbamoyladenylate synthase